MAVKEILGLGFDSNSGKWRVAKSGIYSASWGSKGLFVVCQLSIGLNMQFIIRK